MWERAGKYKPLKDEIACLRVTVILIVVGTLGAITWFDEMWEVGKEMRVKHVQKTALLGTERVLRLVLGS